MELTTVLEMARDCNVKTLGQAINVLRENQDMLFEYEDRNDSIKSIAKDIEINKFKLSDCVNYCINKMNRTNNRDWWNFV